MPVAAHQTKKPTVVLGFPRSGTTLLGRLLGVHPEVSCPPETNFLSACGRFLHEESDIDGPPIGVLSGLSFSNIPEELILDNLRDLFLKIHAEIAGAKSICVEKSGFDIFYVETIEKLLANHARFIYITRHPLDVIYSVNSLVEATGKYLPELHKYIQHIPSQYEAYAAAWVDTNKAVLDFMDREPDRFIHVKYESLVNEPTQQMSLLAKFLDIEEFPADLQSQAFNGEAKVGLGDWRIYESTSIDSSRQNKWKTKITKSALTRILERTHPLLERFEYDIPKVPRLPARKDKIRQYSMAKSMQQSSAIANRDS